MEGDKQAGSSTSSNFTSEIFGSKESFGSSSSGIFGAIFSPSTKVMGGEALRSKPVDAKHDSAGLPLNDKAGEPDCTPQSNEVDKPNIPTNKDASSFYQEEKVQTPCHLSSSIYYGGQDIYSQPQSSQHSRISAYISDGGEDDSGKASRGNWWQGSLYY